MFEIIVLTVFMFVFLFSAKELKDRSEYVKIVSFFHAISNGFRESWSSVREKLEQLDDNPYPWVTEEMYENERRKQLGFD